MPSIPTTEAALLLRTNFSDDAAWRELLAAAQSAPDPFLFTMQSIDDPAYAGMKTTDVLRAVAEDYPHPFIAIADSTAMQAPAYPVLVLDLLANRGSEFRSAAKHLAPIENNLSIGNMGFEEFAEAVDSDGIFQGFGS